MMDNTIQLDGQKLTLVEAIIEYESGFLSFNAVVRLFQYLADNGLVHKLQGAYSRQFYRLVDRGLVYTR